jgi:DNA-binding PadR family transcriptional regulator
MNENKKAVHENIESIVLSMFANSGKLHGYKVITEFRRQYGVYEGASTIYPMIAKFEKQGLIKLVEKNIETGRLQKRYAITEKGRQMLRSYAVSFSIIVKEVTKNINTCNDNIV